jgi:hypothetical protein
VSVRALIEGKQRRTAKLPILVGNPSAAAAAVESARRALVLHEETLKRKPSGKKPTVAERKRSDQLRADLKAVVEQFAAMTVEVELQSLPEDEWEALFGSIEPGEDGGYDLGAIQAPLLAASCTDPELQDEAWWSEQLARPEWTDGDKGLITRILLELNIYGPRFEALGKG